MEMQTFLNEVIPNIPLDNASESLVNVYSSVVDVKY